MPQCKRNDCREPAVSNGPRLCVKHRAEREKRRNKTLAQPLCTHCGTQHTRQVDPEGNPRCPTCRNRQEEEAQEARERRGAALQMKQELWTCETVHDIQTFLEEHVLPKLIEEGT